MYLFLIDTDQITTFIIYPDTTGVTQILNLLNKNIHQEYEKEKSSTFTEFKNSHRKYFMLILANKWGTWTSREKKSIMLQEKLANLLSS